MSDQSATPATVDAAERGRPWRLLSLVPMPAGVVADLLGDLPVEVIVPAEATVESATAAIADADLLLADWSGAIRVDAALLAAAPRLVAVQQPSVGFDSIDLEACTAAGVAVANAAGFNSDSVAEWCLAATLSCLRLLVPADTEVRAGDWPQQELAGRGSRELRGARVGIVGFGVIGQACARLFAGFGCDVGQWSRRRRDEEPWFELSELVERSEILVVLVALGEQTQNLLSAELLASMPREAIIVTAARGGVVDETAVARMVADGRLSAAAFDVFGVEPLPESSPLRGDPRILLSPHTAGSTRQSQRRLLAAIKANIGRALRGEPLVDVVNDVDPLVRRRD